VARARHRRRVQRGGGRTGVRHRGCRMGRHRAAHTATDSLQTTARDHFTGDRERHLLYRPNRLPLAHAARRFSTVQQVAAVFSRVNYSAERAGTTAYFPDEHRSPLRIKMGSTDQACRLRDACQRRRESQGRRLVRRPGYRSATILGCFGSARIGHGASNIMRTQSAFSEPVLC
jgi:hypothetical protein